MSERRLDPALLRGLTQPRLSRRGLFRSGAGVAGIGGMAAFLSACGIQGTHSGSSAAESIDWTSWWAGKKKNGHFSFDNWAAYIDQDKNGKYPTLEKFTKQTGIQVTYNDAAVADPATYYGKIAPALTAGKPISADLFVMTNGWELTELIQNGWVAELDHSRMPNFLKNAVPSAVSPTYDFDALHSAQWQTGYTGIAYHSDMIEGDITGWADLTKPEYKNKVGLLSDLDELSVMSLTMIGVKPETSTAADWQKAADWLKTNLQPNVVKYYDQSYLDAFKSRQLPVMMAYSGDILSLQADFPDAKFVFPSQGFTIWHDNMMIPITAQNPVDALTWIDFYYQTPIAATVEDYIWYVSPVQGVQEYIAKVLGDTDYADSPLAFPPASVLAKAHDAPVMTNRTEHDLYVSIFQPLVQGS